MKSALSLLERRFYCAEVLGAKSYLCPKPVYSLRSLKGPIPCSVLAVVFKALSSSQEDLLKKIMSAIDVLEYSFLEIKDERVLNQLFLSQERLADFVVFFGGADLIQNKLPSPPLSFFQACSLEELEGNSKEVINKKKQLWAKLINWKKLSGI